RQQEGGGAASAREPDHAPREAEAQAGAGGRARGPSRRAAGDGGRGRTRMDRGLSSHQRSLRGSAAARAALHKASGLTARVLVVDHLGSARSPLAGVLRGAGYDVVLVGNGPAAPETILEAVERALAWAEVA